MRQEAKESFAFPHKIKMNKVIKKWSSEIPQKCSKLYLFQLESNENHFWIWTAAQREKKQSKKLYVKTLP